MSVGIGRPLDAFEQQYHEQYYETYYQTYLGVAKDALWQATYNRLIEEGASEEEATAKANEYVETEKGQQQIADAAAKAAEEMIQQRVPSYYYEGRGERGREFRLRVRRERGEPRMAGLPRGFRGERGAGQSD